MFILEHSNLVLHLILRYERVSTVCEGARFRILTIRLLLWEGHWRELLFNNWQRLNRFDRSGRDASPLTHMSFWFNWKGCHLVNCRLNRHLCLNLSITVQNGVIFVSDRHSGTGSRWLSPSQHFIAFFQQALLTYRQSTCVIISGGSLTLNLMNLYLRLIMMMTIASLILTQIIMMIRITL